MIDLSDFFQTYRNVETLQSVNPHDSPMVFVDIHRPRVGPRSRASRRAASPADACPGEGVFSNGGFLVENVRRTGWWLVVGIPIGNSG